MSKPTLPHHAHGDGSDARPPVDEINPRTDEGLRHALRAVQWCGSWQAPAGDRLLAEIRRRAVRNAAHVAAAAGTPMGRGLVDDVLLAAWLVLRRHGDKVLGAARPWAYLMSSAQKQVLDEVRAQQLLTNTASIRGRAREVLPSVVRPVGTSATDLATAFRHEVRGPDTVNPGDPRLVRQIGRHEQPPLVAAFGEPGTPSVLDEREPWFVAFINLLASHGAHQAITVAAVDRLADLFAVTYVGWWEWVARRDPVLARLGLRPDQCGALVALLAGSRRYRHTGKRDSLLVAARDATEQGGSVELSDAQRRRVAVFVGTVEPRQPMLVTGELTTAGV